MKKLLPLLLLSATCLASCGESNFYGKYKFMLGRQGDEETRVSLEIELKNEDASVEGMKQFTTKLELSGVSIQQGGEDFDLMSALEMIQAMFSTDDSSGETDAKYAEFDGYYKVLDLQDPTYGNKVKLALDLGTLGEIEESPIDLSDLVSYFIISYVNKKQFTIQTPVSLKDLQQQLAWYGFYIDYDPYEMDKVNTFNDLLEMFLNGKFDIEKLKVYSLTELFPLPGNQDAVHRYGSHPVVNTTKNEVREMNETYQGVFSNTLVYQMNVEEELEVIGSIFEDITDESGHYYFYPFDGFDVGTIEAGTTKEFDVIMKKDVGQLDYDFSEDTECKLTLIGPKYEEDGSYSCGVNYKEDGVDEWDWTLFMQKPFKFRDYHDIKINLLKE